MNIWLATGNINKKQELAAILLATVPTMIGPWSTTWELKIPRDAGLDFDPEETGNSFFENALIKAGELHRLLEEQRPDGYTPGDPVIADDSGICVDALGGRPGIYSARYCGRNDGRAGGQEMFTHKLSDTERNVLLLAELGDNPRRSASFVCAMALYFSPDRFFIAQETLEGELVKNTEAARGKGGFGYDPILYIPALGRTVAELSEEEKNRWSHRCKAGRITGKILADL